ncbi:DUF2867 domain-containing protein [bacterium]|nr:DUF2867 domain-containing protein [bacterium]
MKVLVTGATGYIGGRLIPLLLYHGHRVRVLVRDPRRIERRPWANAVEVVTGDLEDSISAQRALDGIRHAYYLVHSMHSGGDFDARDRRAAENFALAGRQLKHVVYLGGLVPHAGEGTRHLASRREVGAILRRYLPATELRAGPIIGSGSASFEMVRYLVARLPVMLPPRWVNNPIQPVAVRDALRYLWLALERQVGGVVEVGCEPLSFKRMLEVVAEVQRFHRWIIPTPVMTPRLAAEWIHLVTPIPRALAIPLCEGIIHPLKADTTRAARLFPEVKPISYRRAVVLALGKVLRGEVETSWMSALGEGPTYELTTWEGLDREIRSRYVAAPPEQVFQSFTSLGGERGWRTWTWAWQLRGIVDQLAGGPGLRRGRRHPLELLPGDAVDFWRVERVEPPRLLRLRAEMLLPGRAWLQWEAEPEGEGTRLVQSALFAASGVWGHLYWNLLYRVHGLIFASLVNAIARDAERGVPIEKG